MNKTITIENNNDKPEEFIITNKNFGGNIKIIKAEIIPEKQTYLGIGVIRYLEERLNRMFDLINYMDIATMASTIDEQMTLNDKAKITVYLPEKTKVKIKFEYEN